MSKIQNIDENIQNKSIIKNNVVNKRSFQNWIVNILLILFINL
jgi:hypothetical protein